MSGSRSALLDTDAFSLLFVTPPKTGPRRELADEFRNRLAGRRALICFQTEAEVRYGARLAGWGERRLHLLDDVLSSTPRASLTPPVLNAYVDLRVACAQEGHALQAKVHEADRWVAATAIALGVPLLALDGVYQRAPLLDLL